MSDPTLRNPMSLEWLFVDDSALARLAPPMAERAMPVLIKRWRTIWIMREILWL
jgi:hypothetical protein